VPYTKQNVRSKADEQLGHAAALASGCPRQLAGHKTRSVFDRYNIVSAGDLRPAAALHGLTGTKQGESGTISASSESETSQIATGSGQQTAANLPASQAAVVSTSSDNPRGWMASGFIGTNFGGSRKGNDLALIEDLNTNNSTSVNFGGQIGYLARGVVGGEFLADFSPGLGGFDNLLFKNPPNLNSYMFNLITVAPFGNADSYDPYISGGIGAVTLRSTIFTVDPTRAPNLNALATDTINGTRFGWNIGGGIMAWSERTGASAATCGTTRPIATTPTLSISI